MERKSLRRKVIVLALVLHGCAVPVEKKPEPRFEYLACLVSCVSPDLKQTKTYEAAAKELPVQILGMPEDVCKSPPPYCESMPLYVER